MQSTQSVRLPVPQTEEECKAVIHVNLAGTKHVNDKVKMLRKGPALENLQILDLSQAKGLEDKEIILCVKKFRNITKLNLSGCRKITDKTLRKIGKYLKNLTHLKLSVCPLITDKGIDAVATGCKKLEYLNLALDFYTCEERYKVARWSQMASQFGVKQESFIALTPEIIETLLPKVQRRIEEKTKTELTLKALHSSVQKCEALKTLFVPCILETKRNLLEILVDEGKTLSTSALEFIADLPKEKEGLEVLSYEKEPSLVWSSQQEWYVSQ